MQKRTKLQIFLSIFGHLHAIKKHKWKIGFLMILYIATVVCEPYFYKILMDHVQEEIINPTTSIPHSILLTIIAWIIISILSMASRYLFAVTLLNTQQQDWNNFIIQVIRKMLLLPINYHISIQHGEKQKIIDRSSDALWEGGNSIILRIIPQTIITIMLIILGGMMDIRMTLVTLALLPIGIIGVSYTGKQAYKNQHVANKYWDNLFNRISDSFTNLSITRIFSRQDHEISLLKNRINTASSEQKKVRKLWIGFVSFGQAFVFLAKTFVLSIGIIFVYQGNISLGTLLFFVAFADRIYGPIFSIFESYQNLLINIADYEKAEAIFNMDNEMDTGKLSFHRIEQSITFKNVSFCYPSNNRVVLDNISMHINKGDRIGLVGHTGSGKSTITQLLMRFYHTNSGDILIDNTSIYDFSLSSYRSKFATVFQDTTLFGDTIRHNLEYVRDNITQAEIEQACKDANIFDFITSLPDGWDTEVGERGLKLSGGEKQRIAIARAMLANPEILILDEATSALDSMTERLVQEALDKLMQGRTSIIIAHRLSTVQAVDTIYLIDNGHILAQGNHKDLYKTSQIYKEMVDLQHDGSISHDI